MDNKWINDNVLKERIRFNITAFYDHFYMGDQETKYRHLRLFEEYYDPSRFDNLETEKEDINKFLTELQEMLDNELGFLGG